MYSKTFAISDKTNLGHVLETACYFWGVQKEEYSFFFLNEANNRITRAQDLTWNMNLLMQNTKEPKVTFYIGLTHGCKDEKQLKIRLASTAKHTQDLMLGDAIKSMQKGN